MPFYFSFFAYFLILLAYLIHSLLLYFVLLSLGGEREFRKSYLILCYNIVYVKIRYVNVQMKETF